MNKKALLCELGRLTIYGEIINFSKRCNYMTKKQCTKTYNKIKLYLRRADNVLDEFGMTFVSLKHMFETYNLLSRLYKTTTNAKIIRLCIIYINLVTHSITQLCLHKINTNTTHNELLQIHKRYTVCLPEQTKNKIMELMINKI
jgi:hypothetical protein